MTIRMGESTRVSTSKVTIRMEESARRVNRQDDYQNGRIHTRVNQQVSHFPSRLNSYSSFEKSVILLGHQNSLWFHKKVDLAGRTNSDQHDVINRICDKLSKKVHNFLDRGNSNRKANNFTSPWITVGPRFHGNMNHKAARLPSSNVFEHGQLAAYSYIYSDTCVTIR
ncbi:hypothetical protein PoB_004795900 [Plakobranchus ocellatus]|uniref:Uncharacterized protein n=1 Tax=Plakobranchus ocellatus TaxID=259542 RepID=A0AAV4BMV8_9GAST|nr:hypothetical protein PoB_004795900 [Plakobranchus ocellatus]